MKRRIFGKFDIVRAQTVGLRLFRDQEILGNVELVKFGVARNPDDLHPVPEGQRDGMQSVGRRDEKDFREIIIDVQIMIVEGEILLRVEHFEQRRRRVAPEIGAHLVDFVQAEDRIVAFSPSGGDWRILPGNAPM